MLPFENIRSFLKNSIKNHAFYISLQQCELIFRYIFKRDHEEGFNFLAYLPNEALVLDIGANIGQSIISILNNNRNVNILAFEPNPSCVNSLNFLLKLPLINNKVSIMNYGLGDCKDLIPFYFPVTSNGIPMLQEGTFDFSVLNLPETLSRIGGGCSIKKYRVRFERLMS